MNLARTLILVVPSEFGAHKSVVNVPLVKTRLPGRHRRHSPSIITFWIVKRRLPQNSNSWRESRMRVDNFRKAWNPTSINMWQKKNLFDHITQLSRIMDIAKLVVFTKSHWASELNVFVCSAHKNTSQKKILLQSVA